MSENKASKPNSNKMNSKMTSNDCEFPLKSHSIIEMNILALERYLMKMKPEALGIRTPLMKTTLSLTKTTLVIHIILLV